MEAGYTKTVISEAIAELEVGGFVIRLKGGMYRSCTCPPAHYAAPPASSVDAAIPAQDAAPPASEILLESRTKRKYTRRNSVLPEQSSARLEHSSAPPESFVESPLTLVNDSSTKKEKKGSLISSTREIPALLDGFSEFERDLFHKKCKVVDTMLSKEIANLSYDLVQRVVLAEKLFGERITLEVLNSWRKDANKAVLERIIASPRIAQQRFLYLKVGFPDVGVVVNTGGKETP